MFKNGRLGIYNKPRLPKTWYYNYPGFKCFCLFLILQTAEDSFFVVSFHFTFREENDRFILVDNYVFVTKNPNDLN